jgi:PD-(D/E)XK endonuclease
MDLRRRHPREQGDIGERAAVMWLWQAGAYVFVPFGHSPDYDVIAAFGERLVRVEAKTSTVLAPNSNRLYRVQLATGGGNQSWNRVVKRFADGRRWFIPSQAISSKRTIVVGGRKYSEFKVRDSDARETARRLLEWFPFPGECPSGQRERAVNASAQPTQVRILPPPFRLVCCPLSSAPRAGSGARTRGRQVPSPDSPGLLEGHAHLPAR